MVLLHTGYMTNVEIPSTWLVPHEMVQEHMSQQTLPERAIWTVVPASPCYRVKNTLVLMRLSKHRWGSGREAVECLQRVMTWRDTWTATGHLPLPDWVEQVSAEQGSSENSHASHRVGGFGE